MARTLIRIFLDTVSEHRKDAQFLRRTPAGWEPIPAMRAQDDVAHVALGLRAHGVQSGDRVALLAETRYEWAVADLAILALGAITVPIYATQTAPQVRAVLADAGVRAAVVSTPAQLDKLLAAAAGIPGLALVVPMDDAPSADPRVRSWNQIAGRGAFTHGADAFAFLEQAGRVQPDDVATLIYTSGTTGEPKGAMLTHANIATNVASCLQVVALGPEDRSLSFLPLSHVFERMAGMYAMLAAGVTIAYAHNVESVARDAMEVRPTIITAVPRFYEKVMARVLERGHSGSSLERRVFAWGLGRGRARARAYFARRRREGPLDALADRLVGARVRAQIGGRLRFGVSGGAPLSADVLEFFFAMGIPVIEGYGLTETSPVICLNRLGDETPGSVGAPIPDVSVEIGPEGEILTRGPCVMKGYWHNEAATREALRDGWFHTGDVGRFDSQGRLYITDRLKDLIVTAGGKKVAPQPIEARLKTSRWINEAVLVGDRRPYVSALIVPEFAALEAEARARGWPAGSRQELLSSPGVNALYEAELERVNGGLAPFETIKRFALLERELSQDSGELTPTLKVRRRIVDERYAQVIGELYGPHAHAAPPDLAAPPAPPSSAEHPVQRAM
ncbi:MAG TPA: long-chain fatty acid--CoA ligase [Candidatus Eisenbacteria bacterium]|nr:long-chain fatty acid--CoA ligase [Candidatus Eisenbacteria bacterium]